MGTTFQFVVSELADNWPAFLYIAVTTGFSVCFLQERRRETRLLKQLGTGMQERMQQRFDRLEKLVCVSTIQTSQGQLDTASDESESRGRNAVHTSLTT